MGIGQFMKGKVSPMETDKKTETGEKKFDITAEVATKATESIGLERVDSVVDKAEAARKSLEMEVNKAKTQEQRQAEINDILKSIK